MLDSVFLSNVGQCFFRSLLSNVGPKKNMAKKMFLFAQELHISVPADKQMQVDRLG